MIRPPRGTCCFIIRTACRAHRNAPVRLTSTARCQSSTDTSSTAPPGPNTPALLTSRSRRPHRWATASKSTATESGLLTSVGTTSAVPALSASASPTVSPSSRARRPATATRHPAPSRLLAMHRPRPDPAPVTTATPARASAVMAARSVLRSFRLAVRPAVLRAGARARREYAEAFDDRGQYRLEDGVVGHAGELVPDTPDVRVLGTVDGQVRAGPCGLVVVSLAGRQRHERGVAASPVQREVADRTVCGGRGRALEACLEHRAEHDVDGPHLGRALRRPRGGQRRGGWVGEVCLPEPSRCLGDRIEPARPGREPGYRLLDQPVGNGQDQVILAGEVAVDGGWVGTERAAELGQAEAGRGIRVEHPQALCHDHFRGQAAAAQAPPGSLTPEMIVT